VQRKKELKLHDIVPAMTHFLYTTDELKVRWAASSWERIETMLDLDTFEWAVQGPLVEAFVTLQSSDTVRVQAFWLAFTLILKRMDLQLITQTLPGLEVQPSIFTRLLDHTHSPSGEVVKVVIQALHLFTQKSPRVLWSALGSTSASTVAELIFKSTGYHQLLRNDQNFDSLDTSPVVGWMPDFLLSQDAIHQVETCRSLVNGLLITFQGSGIGISEKAQRGLLYSGLNALYVTLESFNDSSHKLNPTTDLIAISLILKFIDEHKMIIVNLADLPDSEKDGAHLKRISLKVLGAVFNLDCKAISAESGYLEEDTPVERAPRTHSQSIWNSVLDIFRPGNLALAKSILSGLPAITGVDELLPGHKRDIAKMSKSKVAHNKDYHDLQENISKVFARLSDFRSSELQTLRQAPETCYPLFAALLSPNDDTYEAMIEVLKQMTDELGKEEAFSVLLDQCLPEFLNSYNLAVNKVRTARNFGPMSHMLKSGGEVLRALCGNTGVLRSKNNLVKREKQLVYTWWVTQWRTLDVLFSTLEAWAPRVSKDTTYMQDFCRDAMEYAEALFDRYRIVASALREPDASAEDKDAEQRVLRAVCDNINGLTMLLRLRDAYLITVITSFLGKLLRSLGQYDLEVEERASQYIRDACKSEREHGFRRTNLTNQQKAELNRVLQEHQGFELIEVQQKSATRKQPTLDSWSSSAGGQVHQPRLPPSTKSVVPNRSSTTTSAGLGLSGFGLAKLQAEQHARKQKEENAAVQSKDFLDKRKQAALEQQRQKDKAREQAAALRRPMGVAGEGSGMQGLKGVDGKDHAPIRSEIMVGSSDEDSSDDDDADGDVGLLKLRRKGKSGTVAEYEESKRLAMLKAQGPVKKTKVQRSAKDLRARVEPNMDSLYTEILGWDLFHQGDEPPSKISCRKIVDKFYDPVTYKDTFKPLLISEVWRSLVTARDENLNKPIEVTILSRASVDKFMEITSKMPISTKNDFKFKERDIILLSRGTDPINNPTEAHCLARVDRTNRKKDMVEVTFRVGRTISQELVQALSPNMKMSAVKVSDMTTTQREYAALSSLEYYDLCMEVLEAQPSPIQKQSENQMDEVGKRYNLNRGQAKAILAAYDNDGFTCIQGPPGSGKTKTIVSMVGALLTTSLQQEASGSRPTIRGQAPAAVQPRKKLLICAPSNAAVDELVVRLKEGIVPRTGLKQKINVIRLGRSDVINDSVKDVMLDELVRMKLEGDQTEKNKLLNDRDKLHNDAGQIKERLNLVRASLEDARIRNDKSTETTLQREFDTLKRSQAHIGAKIDADKESGSTVSRQNEINRRKYQQEIIDGAHVLCATLSGSGHDMFRNLNVEFETVIIDEAAQCIELSALIPLKYGCTKCILVGDPEQLPPTVLSRSAQSFGYEQSLFVRMQKNFPKDIHLLDTQYRMHPEISRFPSEQFYHGRLLDGPGMAKLRDQPWHESATLGPYRFFDVEGVQTKEARGHSFINVPELNAAMQLYRRLKADYGNTVDLKGKIGIIATYKAQLIELRNRFAHTFGDQIFEEIEFNTTDAFQGREREIIIFSCVRATQTGGIGFLKDIRRMNVGLTRAKSSLWVLGDSRSLQQGEFWNKLIQDAKSRDRYTGGDVMSLLAKPTRKDRKTPSVQASSLQPQPERRISSAGPQSTKFKVEVKEEVDNEVEMVDVSKTKRPGSPMVKVEEKKTKVSLLHQGTMHNLKYKRSRPKRQSLQWTTFRKLWKQRKPPRPHDVLHILRIDRWWPCERRHQLIRLYNGRSHRRRGDAHRLNIYVVATVLL